jgi:signal transduction histidine kinase
VNWLGRWRADLVRPEAPTNRDQLGFLVAGALAITAIAYATDPGSAVDLFVIAPAVAAFVARGLLPRMPAEVFAAMVVGSVTLTVGRDGDLEAAMFLTVTMMLYVAWNLRSLIRAGAILVISAASPWLIATVLVPEAGIAWTPWTSACVFTFILGRELRKQQALIDQLEQARSALAEQAVAEERRRIARELHDLAGHTLAAMLLHVTGARHVLRRDVDEAERALLDAEAVGRASLDQIRATVAGLRTHERGTDRALAGSADLTGLVDEYRRAGLVVEASVPPPVADLDGAVGTALHRIAREALANVARHAPQNRVEFDVRLDDQAVHLAVVDRGHPGAAPDPNEGHFGLVGMRERARALGGELDAGPTADGWRVDARLPAPVSGHQQPVSPS